MLSTRPMIRVSGVQIEKQTQERDPQKLARASPLAMAGLCSGGNRGRQLHPCALSKPATSQFEEPGGRTHNHAPRGRIRSDR